MSMGWTQAETAPAKAARAMNFIGRIFIYKLIRNFELRQLWVVNNQIKMG